MDQEKEILALSAETLALSYIVGNVLTKLARNPSLRGAIADGMDQAADVAQSLEKRPRPSSLSKLSAWSRNFGS